MSNYQYQVVDGKMLIQDSDLQCVIYDLKENFPQFSERYRALLAQKHDMKYAEAYLNQMFFGTDTTLIDGALINSAIQLLIRCFTNPQNKGRQCFDVNKVFKKFVKEIDEEDLTQQFKQFYDARNQVLAHDQINHTENMIGLVVDKNKEIAIDITSLTIRTGYLYKQNQVLLKRMISIVQRYIDFQLKAIEDIIMNEYNQLEKKPDLNEFKCPTVPIATSW